MLRVVARVARGSTASAAAPGPCPRHSPATLLSQACSTASATPSTPLPPLCRLQIDPAHIVSSPHAIELRQETVQDVIWEDLHRWPNNVAVECGVTGRRLTYAQLRDASRRLAVALRSPRLLGPPSTTTPAPAPAVTTGPAPAAAIISNSPEFAVVLLAALEAGVGLSPVNPSYTADEVGRQLVDCGARLVFVDAAGLRLARQASEQMARERQGAPPLLVLVGPGDAPEGVVRLEDLAGPGAPLDGPGMVTPTPDALAVLPYSSGTTGLPKGVLLPHRTIAANLRQVLHPEVSVVREAQGADQERIPAVLPFFHIYGQVVVLMGSMCKGAKVVTLPSFQPESFVRTMIDHKASVMFAVPPLVLFLASEASVPARSLQHLHVVFSGAAPLGLADVERLKARAHPDLLVMQGYGMTEASPVVLQGRAENAGAVGLPIPETEAVVVDPETGVSVPPHREGELCFRGPQIMTGYWQRPEATATTLAEGGWMRSGDIGHTDEHGDFVIVDRAKELIKVKGFQVAPAELEALLRSLPGVADAAVVASADERAGEVPLAYVVPSGAPPADAVAARALSRRVAQEVEARVAPHKRLAGGVRLVASIPKNASGKILRRQLRQHPPPLLGSSS